MSEQWAFLRAVDVWMFRDNKPFSAGQNFVARSQFPPHPQVVYGALRSHLLEKDGVDWAAYARGAIVHELAGTPERYGSLRLLEMSVARRTDAGVEPLHPVPLDVVTEQDRLLTLAPSDADFESGAFDGWRPLTGGQNAAAKPGWLRHGQMHNYLSGQPVDGSVLAPEAVFQPESRVGLGLDHSRRANAEGLYYRAEFVRPNEDVGLLLRLNAAVFEDGEIMNLGGESRSAVVNIVKAPPPLPADRTGRLKLVLRTPAYFSGGWQPADGDWSRWVGDGRLVSAAIGKPVAISGWDIARNRPKPLRHYVPAGSVYYFEDATWTQSPLTETAAGENDTAAAGYGLCAAGTWGMQRSSAS